MNENEFELGGEVFVADRADYDEGCDRCAFRYDTSRCFSSDRPSCISAGRKDRAEVVFLRKDIDHKAEWA
jgi:hypothetical protein